MGDGNGAQFDRRMRAAAAYAEMRAALEQQNARLFGDGGSTPGYLPRIEKGVAGLYTNPLVRFGFWLDRRRKTLRNSAGALAATATIVTGGHQVGVWLGWWK